MKRDLIVANWKMFLGDETSQSYLASIKPLLAGLHSDVWFSVPYTVLSSSAALLPSQIGAQNAHWETEGAFTGEISAPMLKAAGATFSLCGHSERRQLFGESPASAAKRAGAILGANLRCIFCVGETFEQYEQGNTFKALEAQLTPLFDLLKGESFRNELIFAYEPVWAIGTNKVPSLDEISKSHTFIKNLAQSKRNINPRVLYGGSVNTQNFAAIRNLKEVDGALVGRASLDPQQFIALVGSL